MINITDKERDIILSILNANLDYNEVRVFGSRITNRFHRSSDIDLAIMRDIPIDDTTLGLLMIEFADSDLPYKVDILDFSKTSGFFKEIINSNYEVLS